MILKRLTREAAKPFIEQWHYSHCVPKGSHFFFGWEDEQGELYAVADYGNGVNPYQATYLARTFGADVTNDNLVELKRLCRVEPKRDDAPLTRFLSVCHKQLTQLGIKYVVSFSDPEWGHDGGIYKAANFTHAGQTNPEFHVVDASGEVRHRRYPYRYAKRNGCTIDEARQQLGLTRKRTQPKDRWFLRISRVRAATYTSSLFH